MSGKTGKMSLRLLLVGAVPALLLAATCSYAADPEAIDPAPAPADWAALAKLPDWRGVWLPDQKDQNAQIKTNPPPWTAEAAAQIEALAAQEKAGHPRGLFVDCLPEGTPSWMLISHNALEILFTPGRVTLLGESDGNRLRRIYTDGRSHPADPDPSFHGDSVGHWDGDTLVIDTIGVLPQAYLAISEAVGLPNNGDLHVVEHIHLAKDDPNVLMDEMLVEDPLALATPWHNVLTYARARDQDLLEFVCAENDRNPVDAAGHTGLE